MHKAHHLFVHALGSGNVGLAHAKNEVGIDPLGLFVRQAGNGSMELLLGNFPLVKLTRRKRNEKGLMLNTIIPVKP